MFAGLSAAGYAKETCRVRESILNRSIRTLPPAALAEFFVRSPYPSLVVDDEGWVLSANEAFLALAPWSAPGTSFLDAHAAASRSRLQVALISGQPERKAKAELRVPTDLRAGPRLEYRFFPIGGRAIGVVGMACDESSQRERLGIAAHGELRHERDPRTGLVTCEWFLHVLTAALRDGAERGTDLSCIALRVDGLERIRREEGAEAADAMRRALARRLQSLLRDHGPVTALASDRFAFFAMPCDADRARSLGGHVASEIAATRFSVRGGVHRVSARIGFDSGPCAQRSAESVLAAADDRLDRPA